MERNPARQASQEAALAELEAKSAAVLAAEAKMKAIEEERKALTLEAEAQERGGGAASAREKSNKWQGW